MAIITQNENGWMVCSKRYFDEIYKVCKDDQSAYSQFKFKSAFFNIRTPFLTNSKSRKLAEQNSNKDLIIVKKKGKAKVSKIPQDLEIINFIKECTRELVSSGLELRYLEDSEVTPEEWFQNNKEARSAAQDVMNQVDACLEQNSELVCKNFSPYPVIRKFGNDEYLLPPHSTFHLSDITSFFESIEEKFDLIVIDPPWVNKSVKRKKSYNSMKYNVLKDLPVEKLTNPGCLIAVWITNSLSSSSFVLEELFPKCNVITSTVWHWCKITKKGNYVHPIDCHHKKPYESLVLGRVSYDNDATSMKPKKEIGSKKLIVSVPSSLHSHKPPLTEVLNSYIKPNANCLELFARYLLPGWTSVGNEVLKFQNIKLFEKMDS